MVKAKRPGRHRGGAVALSVALTLSALGVLAVALSPDRAFGLLVTALYGPPPVAPEPTGLPVTVHVPTDELAARVSPALISFAVDTSQVVGGHWWSDRAVVEWPKGEQRTGPFDFARPELRELTRHLAPAHLRIGGTEADSVYYAEGDEPTPPGYELRLEREQWDALVDFARATGTQLMFTLNAGPGPRGADGRWRAEQAERLLKRAAATDAPVSTWELGNEVNAFWITHGPTHAVGAEQYAADLRTLRALVASHTPGARIAGPGTAVWPRLGEPPPRQLSDMVAHAGPSIDVLTWHYYPQQSRRCPIATQRAKAETLLSPPVLDELQRWATEVERARERHAPQAEVWLGETGGAQCGGEPGVSDRFASSFWWLDQLGALARRGQQVVVRQTLAGSHYGLIDADTLEPRPDFFASVLFKQLMGTRVLAPAQSPENPHVRVYAHCTAKAARENAGAVTLLALNLDPDHAAAVHTARPLGQVRRFEVRGEEPSARQITLNGRVLRAKDAGRLLERGATETLGQSLSLPPLSYTFVVMKDAAARACD